MFDVFLVDVHNPKDDVKMDVLTPPPKDCQRKAAQDDFLTYDYDLELMDGTKLDSRFDIAIVKSLTLSLNVIWRF